MIDNQIVTKIFNSLNETKIWFHLNNNAKDIVFIGDKLTINALQKYFYEKFQQTKLNSIEYNYPEDKVCLEHIKQSSDISYKAVIIASIEKEQFIYDRLKDYVSGVIVKLFDDIFINSVSQKQSNIFTSLHELAEKPRQAYAIISTPRSGSYLLCNALTSTGLAGLPNEHLREPSLTLASYCNFSLDRYMKSIMSLDVTSNRVFGTKFISHFIEKHIKVSNGKFDPLSYVSKYIYLTREDKVAQAVSLFLAQKSGTWRVVEDTHLFTYQDKIQDKINQNIISNQDLHKIHELYNRLVNEEKYLEEMFYGKNITPLIIRYEELEKDITSSVRNVLSYLNVISESEQKNIKITVKDKKMRTNLSNQIIDSYKQIYK